MKEIWKDIKDYEGSYQISNFGNVKTLKRYIKNKRNNLKIVNGKILKPVKNELYHYVVLCKNSKKTKKYIHRLISQAFIPNPYNKREVNHIDSNKKNNKLENLEWVSSKENKRHAVLSGVRYRRLITTVTDKLTNNIYIFDTQHAASIYMGYKKTYITDCKTKNVYENKKYKWES